MIPHVKLVKDTTELFVKTKQILAPPSHMADSLRHQQACYVYIFENPGRKLRAMYGAALPQQPSLAYEIIANTINALQSSQSYSVKKGDLSSLVYVVAALEPLQRIGDPSQLDPKNFGLYVKSDVGKSAIILPQRNGIETANDQLATAIREAGINTRQESLSMYKFPVNFYE